MSIVELRFEAHSCFREALRCSDPDEAANLTRKGCRLTALADAIESRDSEPEPRRLAVARP
jgi:hypothetical protein